MNNRYLIHYNKNHDRLGRFSSGPGGSKSDKFLKKAVKKTENNDLNFTRDYVHAYASEKSKLRNIGRSDEDISEIALNRVANKNINKGAKATQKYLNKYYNKGFDPNNEKDRIKMGEYYLDIKLSQINIERANQMNKRQGRGNLATGHYVVDPLDTSTKIPSAWEYKTTGDIKREQRRRKKR